MLERPAIYLDSNAGARLHPKVKEALLPFFSGESTCYYNPSSTHSHGRYAKRLVSEAAERVAQSLEISYPEQILFTGSGTEANQAAIRGILEKSILEGKKPHFITTRVEHNATTQMVNWLESQGGEVSYLPVDGCGRPQADQLRSLIQPNTALISIIWVNNETGVISDAATLCQAAREAKVPIHLDGAQAWGKLAIDLGALGADLVSFSAHKIGGMSGTGVLWIRQGLTLSPLIAGKQQRARRGGTENVFGIFAAGIAAAQINPEAWSREVEPLRNRLESEILRRIPDVQINGADAPRVANTTSISFAQMNGRSGLIMPLDLEGYSVSAGSACSSGAMEPSSILLALGLDSSLAANTIRISLSDVMPWGDLEGFVSALERVVQRMRSRPTSQPGVTATV